MLEEESHTGIEQVEEIALCPLVVYELILVFSHKSRHPQPELRIFVNVIREKHCCSIRRNAVFQQFPLCQSLLNRGAGGTCGDPASFHSKAYAPSDMFLVQVGQ